MSLSYILNLLAPLKYLSSRKAFRQVSLLLVLLLLLDLMFIALHLLYKFGYIPGSYRLYVTQDYGYPEYYQYCKEIGICFLLFMLWIRDTSGLYFAWGLLFLYFLLDDSLRIHENFGRELSEILNFQPWGTVRAKDFGEVTVVAFFGSILFGTIYYYYRKSDKALKRISHELMLMVSFIIFFGVIVDFVHMMIPWIGVAGEITEDGGEMIVMSIIFNYISVKALT